MIRDLSQIDKCEGAVPSFGKTVMSQSEQLSELEDVIPHTNDRPARDRQIRESLSDPAETNATPELIDVSALQCPCTEMMERVESRIADMGDTVHAVSTVRTRVRCPARSRTGILLMT